MTKKEIEDKLEEILDEFDYKDYNVQRLREDLYKAFNLGLEVAAENGKGTYDYHGNESDLDSYYENIHTQIDKESILKLKI